MIEIRCAAAEIARQLCEEHGVSATHVWEMIERENRLGWAAATATGEEATLSFLKACEAPLVDALLRAVLNALRAQGVHTAHITDGALVRFMTQKGYFAKTAEQTVEIAEFFSKSACKA